MAEIDDFDRLVALRREGQKLFEQGLEILLPSVVAAVGGFAVACLTEKRRRLNLLNKFSKGVGVAGVLGVGVGGMAVAGGADLFNYATKRLAGIYVEQFREADRSRQERSGS